MDYLSIVFAVVLVVLSIVVSVVGVYVVMVLSEVRRTLRKVNTTLDAAESSLQLISQPFIKFGGLASGMSTGFKVFETFVSWLQKNKNST
jgi:hypothetical protein